MKAKFKRNDNYGDHKVNHTKFDQSSSIGNHVTNPNDPGYFFSLKKYLWFIERNQQGGFRARAHSSPCWRENNVGKVIEADLTEDHENLSKKICLNVVI